MAIAAFTKDPGTLARPVTLDYEIDWSDYLVGDSISTSTWTIPTGITNVSDSFTGVTTTIRLSGGTHGTDYECVNYITTASGQSDERAITIEVRQVEAGSSSDATDRSKAISILNDWVQINVAPVLTQTEVELILDRNKRASTWVSATSYLPGDVVLPTTRNGHRYRATSGGVSGATEPTWTDTESGTVNESDLEWTEDGPDYRNVYDVRAAAAECWALKERKATQFIQTGDLHFELVYQHCHQQRNAFESVRIG